MARTASVRSGGLGSAWRVPAALICLGLVPLAGGGVRLAALVAGGPVTAEGARFAAAPLPIVVHILSATLFCMLGAFQFSARLRHDSPRWHRAAGRVLVLCAVLAGVSGVWMTVRYPLYPGLQGELLYVFRLVFGSAMVVCVALAVAAIRRADLAGHRNWMIRGYAVAQGAGTQALLTLLWVLVAGPLGGLTRDLLMGAGWLINLGWAQILIGCSRGRGRSTRATASSARSSAARPSLCTRAPCSSPSRMRLHAIHRPSLDYHHDSISLRTDRAHLRRLVHDDRGRPACRRP